MHDGREENTLQKQHTCGGWFLPIPERSVHVLGLRGNIASLNAAADQTSRGGILQVLPQGWFCRQLSHLLPLLVCYDRRTGRGPLAPAVIQIASQT